MLFEQNLVSTEGGDIKFIECYDIILRNLSSLPLDRLYFLSPRSNGSNKYALIDYHKTEADFNWIFEEYAQGDPKNDRYSFKIASSVLDDNHFNVTMLYPSFKLFNLNIKNANYMLESCEKVFGAICFEKGKKIESYDHSRPEETTYWIRLAFESKISFDQKLPVIAFGPKGGHKVNIQPCVGMCPNTVLEVLEKDLLVFSKNDTTHDLATKLATEIWDKFNRSKTSTQIADYNICVLTKEDVILLNPYTTGKCSYVGIKNTNENDKGKIVRMWYSGYNQFIENNPVFMAREIYSYLGREDASLPDRGKTAREIASLLGFDNVLNTLHVCQAMVESKLIKKKKAGKKISFYCEKPDYENLLYQDKEEMLKIPASRQLYIKFLDILYSPKKNEDFEGRKFESIFKAEKFGIQYELVYI